MPKPNVYKAPEGVPEKCPECHRPTVHHVICSTTIIGQCNTCKQPWLMSSADTTELPAAPAAQPMSELEQMKAKFEELHPLAPWEIKQLKEGVARAIQWSQRQIKDEWKGFQEGWQAARAAQGDAPKAAEQVSHNEKAVTNEKDANDSTNS